MTCSSSCFVRSILLFYSPTNLRCNSLSAFFPKNHHLTCSPSTASPFESFSISSNGRGSSRRLSGTRSMTTTEMGKEAKKRVEIYELEENLAADLAKFTAYLSDKFCKARGAFTVVVSGGSLIKSLRKLVKRPYVDERVVPKHHHDSNYKLAWLMIISYPRFQFRLVTYMQSTNPSPPRLQQMIMRHASNIWSRLISSAYLNQPASPNLISCFSVWALTATWHPYSQDMVYATRLRNG